MSAAGANLAFDRYRAPSPQPAPRPERKAFGRSVLREPMARKRSPSPRKRERGFKSYVRCLQTLPYTETPEYAAPVPARPR